jgi:2'-5' RNA ligase
MRLFVAVNLPDQERERIHRAVRKLREAETPVRWAGAAALHLTLKFLGEQPADVVPSLSDSVSRVAQRHWSFTLRIGEVGAFPNFRRARVVWMGIERDPKLELLHHDLEVACQELGFEVDGRAFRPHLTLARVKDRTGVDELRRLARASKGVDFEEETGVESIDVMQSDMTTSPSRYERLHVASLRSA